MNKIELDRIGTEMFGVKWRNDMADLIGLSSARMYQIAASETTPARSADKIRTAYEDWKLSGNSPFVGIQETVVSTLPEEVNLTDDQISLRIQKRFSVMNRMVGGMVEGTIRSLIVYGAPGIGKTFDIEQILEKAKQEKGIDYSLIKGTASAPGLYQALYRARNGGICVLDDIDSIYNDEQSFNILKSALDSCDRRVISWRKQSSWVYDPNRVENNEDDEIVDMGEKVPNTFEFAGGVIFITNVNFMERIAKDTRLSPHFSALMSRSLYLDLTLTSMRARTIRIRDVFMGSMSKLEKLSNTQAEEILGFVMDNRERFQELSLRTVKHICHLYKLGDDWKEIVELTKMRMVAM